MISRRVVLAASAFAVAAPALAQTPAATKPPLHPALIGLAARRVLRADGSASTLGTEVTSGRAAVLSFWATWCSPCIDEARHLAQLRTQYAAERLSIVGINLDFQRDPDRMQQFRRRGRVNYTQLLGDLELYQAFNYTTDGRVTLPRCYVFDREGAPVASFGRYFGERTLQEIDVAVSRAVA